MCYFMFVYSAYVDECAVCVYVGMQFTLCSLDKEVNMFPMVFLMSRSKQGINSND